MYVSPWLNTVAAAQMFFIERIFVFFMTLFLQKMGIILSASKTQCHSRLSKPILKILSLYRKNISGKQLSLPICSKFVSRLLHAPKFQIFSTKLNMMVKITKLSQLLYEKDALIILQENTYAGVSFLIKLHAYRLKKEFITGVFL